MVLYPLLFQPRFVEKIWGGRKLETILGKSLPEGRRIGESWELYDFPPGTLDGAEDWTSAVAANGPLAGRTLHQLVERFGPDLYGDVPLVDGRQFPLLIKFLDAREDLSVQVHPPREYADQHPGAHLKTEAWYVLQSEPGARILKGVSPGTARAEFVEAIRDNSVEQHLGAIPAEEGDCHFLPSGTVHALGAGILVAEVQTPSDTTFRVYDFGRLENGNPRKLHIAEAMECIDFSDRGASHPARGDDGAPLVDCPFFRIDKMLRPAGFEGSISGGAPVVWMMLSGAVEFRIPGSSEATHVTRGQTVLLPAALPETRITTHGACTWLEVNFPQPGTPSTGTR